MSVGRAKKRRQRRLAFSWKSMAKTILLATIVAALFVTVSKLRKSEYYPITSVKVFGVSHVDPSSVQTLLTPLVSKGFFAVDVDRIKEQVLQLPWVSWVVVRRIWPNQVIVAIHEKEALATWNDGSLLSSSGELFHPPTESYPTELPQFVGPTGEQIFMTRYYARMSKILSPLHFKIVRLELTPAMAWNVTLANGMKLNVGRKDILTRLNHFVKVYPKIVGDRVADIEYIDLRYPNGMAVRWKAVT